MNFQQLQNQKKIYLYAGDIYPYSIQYDSYVGLSLTQDNENHIKFNISERFPLPDCSVDIFQSEDVFEHIPYNKLYKIVDEIFRILKPNGLFRLSVPDYNCDILYKRSLYDFKGDIVFDPDGGGTLDEPGHVWFPVYENVKKVVEKSLFKIRGDIEFLHYYIDMDNFVTKKIDYSKAYIARTPDHDIRVRKPYRPMSIVVDLIKIHNQ